MITSPAGIALIQEFEGCILKAYRCPAGVLTIGYGHTGPDVKSGMVISHNEADDLLRDDLKIFERNVSSLVGDAPTSQNQFDAMVCLAFNIGVSAFRKSSVLREHCKPDYTRAADSFLLWNKAGGKILQGLVRRRKAERALYLGES